MSQIMIALAASQGGPLFTIFSLEVNSITTTTWAIMLVLAIVSYFLTRGLKLVPENKRQLIAEMTVEPLMNFLSQVIGSKSLAQKYYPILGSYFIAIIIANYSGLLPGANMIRGFQAPTSALSYTIGLSIVVFILTHTIGIKEQGLMAYLKHFFTPFAFMLPLNLMEEIVRPLSLSLRLYGNIYAEETLTHTIFNMVPLILPLPFMIISAFFGLIQALIFVMLTSTYIGQSAGCGH